MAASAPKTIILKGEDVKLVQYEHAAGGAITPGMMVELSTAGTVVVNSTAADAVAETTFAIEDDIQGRGIADAYASGERVRYAHCGAGAEVYAWVEASANPTIGMALESAGDGTLQARTTGRPVATALEALTNTVAARCRVRVI